MIDPHEFEQLKSSVDRLDRALLGDHAMGDKGFIKNQESFQTEMRERISSIETWRDQIKLRIAGISGALVAVGFIANRAWEYFTHSTQDK